MGGAAWLPRTTDGLGEAAHLGCELRAQGRLAGLGQSQEDPGLPLVPARAAPSPPTAPVQTHFTKRRERLSATELHEGETQGREVLPRGRASPHGWLLGLGREGLTQRREARGWGLPEAQGWGSTFIILRSELKHPPQFSW